MVNSCIVNKAREMFILTFLHTKGDALTVAPQLDRWPEIAHAALIEMKYVKAGDPAPTPQDLADIKSKAIAQLDRYSSDSTLVSAWHLKPSTPQTSQTSQTSQTVSLHRFVLVFHGGDCVLAEEV